MALELCDIYGMASLCLAELMFNLFLDDSLFARGEFNRPFLGSFRSGRERERLQKRMHKTREEYHVNLLTLNCTLNTSNTGQVDECEVSIQTYNHINI